MGVSQVAKDFIYYSRELGLYSKGNPDLIEVLKDNEARYKCECNKPWRHKN